MARRILVRVTWSVRNKLWALSRVGFVTAQYERKQEAVSDGATWCRSLWKNDGRPAQLVVHNKAGRGKGRISFERTYGRDPRRYKG